MEVNIYHFYHSGVAVETAENLLVFDYVSGNITENLDFTSKKVYVFVSHRHGDHFSPVIFDWAEVNPDINYILSDDIRLPRRELKLLSVGKDEVKRVGGVVVKTFGSTDQGVSFLIEIGDLKIFHAGDLNWWHWKSFSEEQLKREEQDFKSEVDRLKGERIDIAFVPVDPRLEEYYHLAGSYVIS